MVDAYPAITPQQDESMEGRVREGREEPGREDDGKKDKVGEGDGKVGGREKGKRAEREGRRHGKGVTEEERERKVKGVT